MSALCIWFFPDFFLFIVCFCFSFGLCLLLFSFALYFLWMGSILDFDLQCFSFRIGSDHKLFMILDFNLVVLK